METVVASYPPTFSGEFERFTVLVYIGAQMEFYLPTNDIGDLADPADQVVPMTRVTIVAKDGSLVRAFLEHFRWDKGRSCWI
jgi:hypothetical protein